MRTGSPETWKPDEQCRRVDLPSLRRLGSCIAAKTYLAATCDKASALGSNTAA
jgi:hypothetical protein